MRNTLGTRTSLNNNERKKIKKPQNFGNMVVVLRVRFDATQLSGIAQ